MLICHPSHPSDHPGSIVDQEPEPLEESLAEPLFDPEIIRLPALADLQSRLNKNLEAFPGVAALIVQELRHHAGNETYTSNLWGEIAFPLCKMVMKDNPVNGPEQVHKAFHACIDAVIPDHHALVRSMKKHMDDLFQESRIAQNFVSTSSNIH